MPRNVIQGFFEHQKEVVALLRGEFHPLRLGRRLE